MLHTVAGEAFVDVSQLSEDEFYELARLGSKSLYLAAISKAMQAVAAIDPKELAKASPVAAATVAGILVDKAGGPLSQMANVTRVDETPLTYEDIQGLLRSVRGRVKTLEGAGVKITMHDSPPGERVVTAQELPPPPESEDS